jgi:hypothetical protein
MRNLKSTIWGILWKEAILKEKEAIMKDMRRKFSLIKNK